MPRRRQSKNYKLHLYDRPQDEWTCGHAAEGCPCVFGPGAKGECRATGQCMPAKKGETWVCTRTIAFGGACTPGPQPDGTCGCPVPPCRPVRSLRSLRGRLSWLTAGAALAVGILALWSRDGTAWTNPGSLTAQHATSTHRCADCHVEPSPIAITAVETAARRAAHDHLCLKCHDLGPHDQSPHGVDAAHLSAMADQTKSNPSKAPMVLAVAQPLVRNIASDLACAACHQEHHGQDFALTKMSDQQCQVCHQAQFANFTSGHPEFTNFPSKRRTRLRFDHAAHLLDHFLDPQRIAKAPTSCSNCHEPAGDGYQMLVRGFEQSCAQCHAGPIAGEGRPGAKGLVFFRLPGVDLSALQAEGEPVGEWPAFCEGDLTPFMRWLLEGDADTRTALAVLGPLKLSDLSSATTAQKKAATQVLWRVKSLLADLVTQGQQVMLRRMNQTVPTTSMRVGQLPADSFGAAQQAWLPNLLTEVAAYRRGEKPPRPARVDSANSAPPIAPTSAIEPAANDDLLSDSPAPVVVPQTPPPSARPPAPLEMDDAERRVTEGGWYRRDETYTLYYRPGGHADPFLTAWLDATAHDPAPAARAIFAQLSDPLAPGLCMKCHSIDATKTTTVVNWQAARPQPNLHPFTFFKHAAHFSLMGDQGCKTCHALDPKSEYATAFGSNRNPAVFHSNFAPLNKNTCTNCHQPGAAGASCQQCHKYHTGTLQTLRAPESDFKRPPAGG